MPNNNHTRRTHAERIKARGILLQAEGLAPTAAGARVRLSNAKVTVMDGPFAETKEVIGGFAILNAGSRADAIELARQFMQLHADILGAAFEAECESVKCSMRRRAGRETDRVLASVSGITHTDIQTRSPQ